VPEEIQSKEQKSTAAQTAEIQDPAVMQQNTAPGQPSDTAANASNSLRIAYKIAATSGDQSVMVLDSSFELPCALHPEFIALADTSCSKLFELLVSTPLQTGIRAFLRTRFEELCSQGKDSPSKRNAPPHTVEASGSDLDSTITRERRDE
jgi:hypothetical protein